MFSIKYERRKLLLNWPLAAWGRVAEVFHAIEVPDIEWKCEHRSTAIILETTPRMCAARNNNTRTCSTRSDENIRCACSEQQ